MLRERFVDKEAIKSGAMDKSAQLSSGQREGKQIAQSLSIPKKSKKQTRKKKASYAEIDILLQQDASQKQPLKKFRRV